MTTRTKLLLMLPYFLTVAIVAYCWALFIARIYYPEWRHWVALVLVVINGVFYLRRLKTAVILTGILLVLATINLLAFFPTISWISIGAHSDTNAIYTPGIQLKSLLLLIFYAIMDGGFVADLYVGRKEIK